MVSTGFEGQTELPKTSEWRDVDGETFRNEIIPRDRPAVLKGLVAHWPVVRAAVQSSQALYDYIRARDLNHPTETFIAAPHMTLYSGPLSMFGAKAHIAALEKGFLINLVMVPFSNDLGYEPKHPEVLRINPKRQVPVLIHGDIEIFDSTQIFEYFEHLQPRPPLWPNSVAARAQARLWELKSDEVCFPHAIRLMSLQKHLSQSPAQDAIAHLWRYYQDLEALLVDREFIGGEYSYADIAFFMAQSFAERLGAPMDDTSARLCAWRDRIAARPTLVHMIQTLTGLKRQIPRFMSDAVADGAS